MAGTYQPRARLVCVTFLVICLLGGLAVHPSAGVWQRANEENPPANLLLAAQTPPEESATPVEAILAVRVAHVSEDEVRPVAGPTEPSRLATEMELPTADEQETVTLYRICRVTAYCDRGTTAAGVPSGVGQCAAPGYIPLGAKVYIPALDRTFTVTDRTHRRFRNSTVDIFIPSKKQCRDFGRRFLECEFIVPAASLAD